MFGTIKRLRAFLTAGLWEEREPRSRLAATALHQFRVFVLSARDFLENRCRVRATALAYTTLLSLVPLLALAFALAKGLGAQEQIRPMIDKWLAANQEGVGEKLAEFIATTNDYVRNTRVGALGAIGFAFLVWATINVLGTIEASFNDIWRVRRSRTLLRKFTDYISFLVVGPLLLVAATSAGAAFRSTGVIRSALSVSVIARMIEVALVLIPTWVAFAAAYKFMPNTRVRLVAALAGGIVAGTVWQAAFWGYTTFQVGIAKYNAIYGTFAALPVFMIWLYLSWAIVLFGAEVSWATQNLRRHWEEARAGAASFAAKEAVALRAMAALAVAFQRDGTPLSAEQIADRIQAPGAMVSEAVQALVSAGICSEVVRGDGTAFQPGRPLEKISPADVLDALRERGAPVRLGDGSAEAAAVLELLAADAAARKAGLAAPTYREIAARLAEGGREKKA